jgi:hypothetical protein
MDLTAFALKLIKAYNAENNRLRRARNKVNSIKRDNEWRAKMAYHYFSLDPSLRCNSSAWDYKRSRAYFYSYTQLPVKTAFVSYAAKNSEVQQEKRNLCRLRSCWNESSTPVKESLAKIEEIKKAPVYPELGKKWQQLVDAQLEEKKAYDDRWEARCAIKAFNKMNLGIQIKFGSCRRGGGSMSYISHVEVNGDKIKLAKFLDNTIFETAILSG